MNYYDILCTLCNMNDYSTVTSLLSRCIDEEDTLDVLKGDAILFKLALSYDNPKICAALLDFFETKQNPSEEEKERLKDILEEATSFAYVSPEMQKVLKNYIPIDDTRLSDVTSIDLDTILDNNPDHEIEAHRNRSISTEDSNILALTEANLSEWNNKNPSRYEIIGIPAYIPHDHEG